MMDWPLSVGYPELLLLISLFLFLRALTLSRIPLNLPVFGSLLHVIFHYPRFHDWCADLLRSSGCTALLYSTAADDTHFLLTCDPANVHHVFSANFANYPKGDDFSAIFDFLGGGIFNADAEPWRHQRRLAHAFLADRRLRSSADEACRAKVAGALLPFLDAAARKGTPVDLQDVFSRLTFDLTSTLVFGIDPGCLSLGLPTVPFAKAMDEAEEVLFFRHVAPKPCWQALRWLNLGPERKMKKAVAVMDHFIGHYIARRRSETCPEAPTDLLSLYLGSQAEIKENGHELDSFLRDTTLNFLLAGRDTTTSALSWFFWLVANNPDVEAKILDEVRANSDVSKLVYLHAALCESLRLYPPVPLEHKRPIRPDVLPSGHVVDEKRRLIFCLYAMGRMEGVWGEDCREFRPERWINPATGRVRVEPSYKFFTFNSGPRTCLGRDIAFAQMKEAAAAVIGRFRVEVLEGFEARPKLSIILHMKDGLRVRVKRRGSS